MWWVASPVHGLWLSVKTLVILDVTVIEDPNVFPPPRSFPSLPVIMQTGGFELDFSLSPLDLACMSLDREIRV